MILLSAYGGPYEGSFIPSVRALCEGARDRGWSAETVFSPDAEGRPWLLSYGEEMRARLAPDRPRRELGDWIGEVLSERGGPAILHTHFTRYDLPSLHAARRRGGTAVIWHVHTPLYTGPRASARNVVKYGLLGRRVDAILASGAAPARTLERVGAPRDRLEVAGSGVRTDRFPLASDAERAAAREELGIPAAATVLLHFGWHWGLKDGDLFLAAVEALSRELPDRELIALSVGADPAGDAAIADSPAPVRMLAPRDDIRGLYAAADAFVSSSRVEGEPFAVIEAILSGLPVAATDLPGHRDVCGGLASCRIAGERTPEALAAGVRSLLERPPDEAATERAASRERVAARFDLTGWAERMLGRYESALAAASSRLPR